MLPDSVLAELRTADAIMLGAVGDPSVPPGILERGLLLRLRAELDLYVNLRPSKLRPGVAAAVSRHRVEDLDLVIVRENTEGLYAGAGGTVHRGTAMESATEESLNTQGRRRAVHPLRGRAGRAAQRQAHAGAQDQRAHPRRRPVDAHGQGRGRRDRRHARLRARRRGLPVPRRQPRPVRRDRHRQPVRRHPDRPRRGADRRTRRSRRAATSTRTGPARRCSSRSTARRRTSPAPGRPTRPARCCQRP